MGLDMYLTKKTYVKNWSHMSDDEKHKITVRRGGKIRKDIKPERISLIEESVAYWRKANQIHNWFVDNVQEGVDDCKEYYVDETQLEELLELCKKVKQSTEMVEDMIENGYTFENGQKKYNYVNGKRLVNTSVAKELLPTSSGFFFGGTGYDEWYMQQIDYTIETIEGLLKEGGGDFYYQSSW